MYDEEEKVLDEKQWKAEAQAVINDVKNHVQYIDISDKLKSSKKFIYLNLTTLEGLEFCIELSGNGFTIVGNQHNDPCKKSDQSFETPYSLLNYVSPQYKDAFKNDLIEKLNNLSNST